MKAKSHPSLQPLCLLHWPPLGLWTLATSWKDAEAQVKSKTGESLGEPRRTSRQPPVQWSCRRCSALELSQGCWPSSLLHVGWSFWPVRLNILFKPFSYQSLLRNMSLGHAARQKEFHKGIPRGCKWQDCFVLWLLGLNNIPLCVYMCMCIYRSDYPRRDCLVLAAFQECVTCW